MSAESKIAVLGLALVPLASVALVFFCGVVFKMAVLGA